MDNGDRIDQLDGLSHCSAVLRAMSGESSEQPVSPGAVLISLVTSPTVYASLTHANGRLMLNFCSADESDHQYTETGVTILSAFA